MDISRRSALKTMVIAAAGTTAAALATAKAEAAEPTASPDAVGMLYDATLCVGCKACMMACNKANDVTPDTALSDGRANMPPDLDEHALNIIKVYNDPVSGQHSYIKRQCMHCVDPACVSACMLGALHKAEYGIVVYDPSFCVGCRYCEMACPFNIPKMEWSKVMPKIEKCQLCHHRIVKGQKPACCEVCPVGAVIYGKRVDLLAEAHRRLEKNPGRYLPRVYGEHEAGGTQVLYLAHMDFDKLGLPAYGDRPVPETVHIVQHTIYQGFVAPVVLYGLLAGVMWRNRKGTQHKEGSYERP
jgi:Fe-S-cluster-containing dehydrogenase component